MPEQFYNTYLQPLAPDTTLSADYTIGDGILHVVSLPATITDGVFRVKIGAQIFKVLSIGGTGDLDWTVDDTDFEDTTDADHPSGSAVNLELTAGAMEALRAEIPHTFAELSDVDVSGVADGDSLVFDVIAGDWVPSTGGIPTNLDDLTDVNAPSPSDGDVLTWDAGGGEWVNLAPSGGSLSRSFMGMVPLNAPPSSGWSWDNQGSSTISSVTAPDGGNTEYITVPNNSSQYVLRYRSVTFPKKVTFAILHDFSGTTALTGAGGEPYGAIACGLRDGTGKLIVFYIRFQYAQVATYTNSSGAGGTVLVYYGPVDGSSEFTLRQPQFLQVEDDGTNIKFRVSIDGVTWVQWYSAGRTAFFGSGPTQVCWGGWSASNLVHASLIGYDEV